MKRKISILSNILIMTFASILTTMNISADNTIGMSLGESETIGTSSLSKVFGDVNCDGVCNILDTIALKNYLIEGKENQFYNYNINQNGSVDKFDLYNLNQIVTGEVKTLEDIPMYYKITNDEIQEFLVEHRITEVNEREYICMKVIDKEVDLNSLGLSSKEHRVDIGDKCYYDNKYDIISKDELQYLDINIENHYYYYVIIDINDISTTKLARTYITILKKCPNLYSIGIKHF